MKKKEKIAMLAMLALNSFISRITIIIINILFFSCALKLIFLNAFLMYTNYGDIPR